MYVTPMMMVTHDTSLITRKTVTTDCSQSGDGDISVFGGSTFCRNTHKDIAGPKTPKQPPAHALNKPCTRQH